MTKKLFEKQFHGRAVLFVRLLFEPRDIWIGVYWNRAYVVGHDARYDVYVCLIPMLPIQVGWRMWVLNE